MSVLEELTTRAPKESTKKARTKIMIHGASEGGAEWRRGRRGQKDEQQCINLGMDQRHEVDLASLSARVDSRRVVARSSVVADTPAGDDSGGVEARCSTGPDLLGRPTLVEFLGRRLASRLGKTRAREGRLHGSAVLAGMDALQVVAAQHFMMGRLHGRPGP